MPIPATKYIWFNGKLVPWEKATVHVLSHALHYGSVAFEGIRSYEQASGGGAVFRLDAHVARLRDSCEALFIPMLPNDEVIRDVVDELLDRNGLVDARLRHAKVDRVDSDADGRIDEEHGAQSVKHGACRPQPDPEIDVTANAIRLGMPFEPEHEGFTTDRPAGVQQPDRQITAARDDAELRKHSPRGVGRSDATLPRG